MLIQCMNCGKYFDVKKFKGVNMSLNVCSIDCFKQFIKNYKPKYTFEQMFSEDLPFSLFVNMTDEIDFRSNIERDFHQILKDNNIEFDYEAFSIFYRKRVYIPDFCIKQNSKFKFFIEIKDKIWENSAYSKFKTAYNLLDLFLIDKELIKVWRKNA